MNPIIEAYSQPLPPNSNPDFYTIMPVDWPLRLEADPPLLSGEGFSNLPIHGPVGQEQEDRAPSWGPSRHLRSNRIRKTEKSYQVKHESSRTIVIDRTTDIYLGYARIDANNPSNGQV